MKLYYIIYLISLYISLCGLLNKAGYKTWYGLIPIYNFYLFFKVLKINPIIIIITGILLITLPCRMLIFTILLAYIPPITCYTYSSKTSYGIIGIFFPAPLFLYLAYMKGYYAYEIL